MFDGGQVRKKKKKKKDYFDVLAAHVGRRRAPQMVSPFLTEKKKNLWKTIPFSFRPPPYSLSEISKGLSSVSFKISESKMASDLLKGYTTLFLLALLSQWDTTPINRKGKSFKSN